MGTVSWPLVGGNYCSSRAKILAAGRNWESAITRGLEYNWENNSVPFSVAVIESLVAPGSVVVGRFHCS